MKTHEEHNKNCCANEDTQVTSSRDLVCGMDVAEEGNSLHHEYQGTDYYFCSSHCLKAFAKNPSVYLSGQNENTKEGYQFYFPSAQTSLLFNKFLKLGSIYGFQFK